jgi:hypothetical protein
MNEENDSFSGIMKSVMEILDGFIGNPLKRMIGLDNIFFIINNNDISTRKVMTRLKEIGIDEYLSSLINSNDFKNGDCILMGPDMITGPPQIVIIKLHSITNENNTVIPVYDFLERFIAVLGKYNFIDTKILPVKDIINVVLEEIPRRNVASIKRERGNNHGPFPVKSLYI